MIDATPKKDPFKLFSDLFNEEIDAAQKEYKDQETPRDYLGGSRLGVHCERALGYEYHKTPKDEGRGFSGRVYRIFDRGHDGEARMAEYLKRAGFDLEEEKPSGGQWGFAVAQDEEGIYRLRGHADGIIRGGPSRIGSYNMDKRYPMLWENKIIKSSRYAALQKAGAKESEWEYFVQCQVYMAYLGLEYALFTAVNADTMHVHAELIPLDLEIAQAASDKGVRVIKSVSPEELPKIAHSQTDFRCRWCDWQDQCWATKEVSKDINYEKVVSNWIE